MRGKKGQKCKEEKEIAGKYKTTWLSYSQGKWRVKQKGIYLLDVEGFWIWPWNISNLIFCTLFSPLTYPTFLGQMLSKTVGFIPKVTTHFSPDSWKLYLALYFPHIKFMYFFLKIFQHATRYPLIVLIIFFILMTNYVSKSREVTNCLGVGVRNTGWKVYKEVLIRSQSKKCLKMDQFYHNCV